MRLLRLGFGAFTGLALLGVSGCAEDNEKAANITSVAPASGTAGAAKTQEEYRKNNPGTSAGYGSQGYPGAKK